MKNISVKIAILILFSALIAISLIAQQSKSDENQPMNTDNLEQATFGAGCFWCVEAVFEDLKGVTSVKAGYAGGEIKNPTYRQVASGSTKHAEVARLLYDPEIISYEQLLTVFWHTHNPTTLNRQGADVGPQYRSVIFYHNDKQKEIAERSLQEVDRADLWEDPIVTQIEPVKNYSEAEDYHQNYYENNPNAGYCQVVIAPKLKKFRNEFPHLLKDDVSQVQ